MRLRLAGPHDVRALRRLAELTCAPPLPGRVMVAEVNGRLLAAVSFETGRAIADPFDNGRTIPRLRLRRYQIMHQGSDVAPASSLFRRLMADPAR